MKRKRAGLADILITIFLGFLGLHRLLKGNTFSALLYLLTLGFFAVGWLADIYFVIFKGPKIRFFKF